jgi:DNA-binding NtrC family response regulator
MPRNKVLVVEDDSAIRFGITEYLESQGYIVREAEGCIEAEVTFRSSRPDAVISDYRLPDGNALELLPRLRNIDADIPVILLTGHGTVDLAVQAIKEGADHFLTKPLALPALQVVLERTLENHRARQRQKADEIRQTREVINPFVGSSAAIQLLERQAGKVIGAERPIWLRGETGAGKGVLARWLHHHGPRADEAFIDLNCASLPRELLESELFGHERGAFTGAVASKLGILELANRGTLLLDEIGDMEIGLQPKLLTALEEQRFRRVGEARDRQVDVQLVAATHQDLSRLVAENKFRSDLYYRISTIPLDIPALRDRVEDIPVLARQLLSRLAKEIGRPGLNVDGRAESLLMNYPWPGNIRELRNVLERAVLLSGHDVLGPKDLVFDRAPTAPGPTGDRDMTLEELERHHIARVLREENGRVERAATRLGVPRSSLYSKIKRLQIVVEK